MDKLTWFKFSPTDWFMGKIQRCPEVTQARFIRLCCLYWNKECELSIDDAIIEIDKEHFDVLVSKKIISVNQTNMNIAFLDEQFLEIKDESKNKSKSGIIGNLKRWYPSIYADFLSKKISLEEAVNLSKVVARQSHTDSTPIADQSQSVAEKIRQEETREEKIRQEETREEKIRQEETREDNKPKKQVFSESVYSCYYSVVEMFDEVNRPKKENQINDWLDTIDKLNRLDGLGFNDIIHLVELTRNDSFWSKNFLTLKKLRMKNKDGVMYWNVFYNQFKQVSNKIYKSLNYDAIEETRRLHPDA